MGEMTRLEGQWSPKPRQAGSNPVSPATLCQCDFLDGRSWSSGLGPGLPNQRQEFNSPTPLQNSIEDNIKVQAVLDKMDGTGAWVRLGEVELHRGTTLKNIHTRANAHYKYDLDFSHCPIGTKVELVCLECKVRFDITDYDSW